MPLYVKVEGKRETWGPYPERALRRILAFARIGSQTGRPRRVVQVCGRAQRLVRRYVEGKRVHPKRKGPVWVPACSR